MRRPHLDHNVDDALRRTRAFGPPPNKAVPQDQQKKCPTCAHRRCLAAKVTPHKGVQSPPTFSQRPKVKQRSVCRSSELQSPNVQGRPYSPKDARMKIPNAPRVCEHSLRDYGHRDEAGHTRNAAMEHFARHVGMRRLRMSPHDGLTLQEWTGVGTKRPEPNDTSSGRGAKQC